MERPNHIPNVVGQALAWLDNMKLPYRYCAESDLWELTYKGYYVLIPNDVEEDELGFIAPAMTHGDNEDTYRMVFDLAVKVTEGKLPECDVQYVGQGLCQVSQWWKLSGRRQKLFKYRFIEKLNEIHEVQLKFWFTLSLAYDALFNPSEDAIDD